MEKMIELQNNEIPIPGTNPATGMIKDTLDYHGATQVEEVAFLCICPSVLCDILKGRKGVSADFALRFERCLGSYPYKNPHSRRSEDQPLG